MLLVRPLVTSHCPDLGGRCCIDRVGAARARARQCSRDLDEALLLLPSCMWLRTRANFLCFCAPQVFSAFNQLLLFKRTTASNMSGKGKGTFAVVEISTHSWLFGWCLLLFDLACAGVMTVVVACCLA